MSFSDQSNNALLPRSEDRICAVVMFVKLKIMKQHVPESRVHGLPRPNPKNNQPGWNCGLEATRGVSAGPKPRAKNFRPLIDAERIDSIA